MSTVSLEDYLGHRPQLIVQNSVCASEKPTVAASPRVEELQVRPWPDFESLARSHAQNLISKHQNDTFRAPGNFPEVRLRYRSEASVSLMFFSLISCGLMRDLAAVLADGDDTRWILDAPEGAVALMPDYVLLKSSTIGAKQVFSARSVIEVKKPHTLPELEPHGDLVAAIDQLLTLTAMPDRSALMGTLSHCSLLQIDRRRVSTVGLYDSQPPSLWRPDNI
jgi:hypothetical protein